MLMMPQAKKYSHKQKINKTCSHAPSLLAIHHQKLLGREHSTKEITIDRTQRNKVKKILVIQMFKCMCLGHRVKFLSIAFVGEKYRIILDYG